MDSKHRQGKHTPKSSEDAPISYEYTNRYLKNRGLGNYAKDIYQHMCYNLERAKQQGTFVNSKEYAFTTLRRLATDKQRQLDRKRKLEERLRSGAKTHIQDCQAGCPQHIVIQRELMEIVECAITKLGLRKRMVLRLRLFQAHKFTFSEIAKIIDCSESTARMDYQKAIKSIENQLNSTPEV
jgi:RNA polymerase sigma factor (sigma-70 family)